MAARIASERSHGRHAYGDGDAGRTAADSLYNGTIVLTSTSPSVERPEAIRVALWKSSTNPVNVSRLLPDLSASWVANPGRAVGLFGFA